MCRVGNTRSSYAVLESNGLVWMLNSLLSNRKLAAGGAASRRPRQPPLGPPPVAKDETTDTPPAPTPATVAPPAAAARINIQNVTQKLPPGQSLITVADGSRALMQASSFGQHQKKNLFGPD